MPVMGSLLSRGAPSHSMRARPSQGSSEHCARHVPQPRQWAAWPDGVGIEGHKPAADRLFASGADIGHLQPLLCMLSKLAEMPAADGAEVSVYDLGGDTSSSILSTPARRQLLLKAHPRVRLVAPPWASMPRWSQLNASATEESARKGHYAWKPASIATQLARARKGSCVLWLDAEVQVTAHLLNRFCAAAEANGGFASPMSAGLLRNWTHPRMLDALAVLPRSGFDRATVADAAGAISLSVPSCDAGMVALVAGTTTAELITRAWVRCAMTLECIAPKGSTRSNHRQDQSALSLLVGSLAAQAGKAACVGFCHAVHPRLLGPNWGDRRGGRVLCPALAKAGTLGARPAGERHFRSTGALATLAPPIFAEAANDELSRRYARIVHERGGASRVRPAANGRHYRSREARTNRTRVWMQQRRRVRQQSEQSARAKWVEARAWLLERHSEGGEFLHETRPNEMWTLFPPSYPCMWTLAKSPSAIERHDGGKWICGLAELGKEMLATARGPPSLRRRCTAYSFGSENKFHFEAQVQLALQRAGSPSACEIHTFDPTVVPMHSPYYTAFHSVGLAASRTHLDGVGPVWPLADLLVALGHDSLDILKIDVEGAEWEVLRTLDWASLPARVGQILLEVHPCAGRAKQRCRAVPEVLEMWTRLEAAGYRLFSLEPVTKTDRSQVEVSWIHRQWTPAGWIDDEDDEPQEASRSAKGRRLSSVESKKAAQRVVADSRAPTIASIQVGLTRTLMHPLVVDSYRRFASSIEAQGVTLSTFVVVGVDIPSESAVRRAYNATSVLTTQPTPLACNEQCATPCVIDKRNDTIFRYLWLQQFERVRLAYLHVAEHEQLNGVRYDWLLKLRPDLVFFDGLPLLATLRPHSVFVPRGIMTSRPTLQLMNDHVFLCPRALCKPYFVHPTTEYRSCIGNALDPFVPPQRLLLQAYEHPTTNRSLLHLFNLSYTIARESAGPACGRLQCEQHRPEATGCVAPNLLSAVAACMRLHTEWRSLRNGSVG